MSSMERLPTDKVRPSIDLVNLLHSLRLGQDMALPAIAVIGDKSSGKSSVLEALSGVALPRGREHTLVLQLHKSKGNEWNGVVKKINYASVEENKIDPHNRKDVPDLLRRHRSYVKDEFLLEISSPDVPDLTLIDLPSIPSVAEPHIIKEVKTGIRKIITNPEVIILMVVPCDVNIATTDAFKMAQEVDPDGERTLGLLTKPDIVNPVKEKAIVETVQNKVVKIKKGFMIVRCYDQTKMSLMDPSENEVKFFKEHAIFKSLYDEGHATVPKLAERLSQELAQHIEKYLPQLKEYVKRELLKVNAAMKKYGKPPPSDEADKLAFLTDKLNTFIQDVMRLTTGELLDLTDQNVFSVWRKIVKNSEESFQQKLAAEVELHEQSGSSDFQSFDHVIKDQIRLLEEPALFTLNTSAEIVKKELLKVMESAFFGFKNLISKANTVISKVTSSNQKAAESLLRTQFKMEQFEFFVEGRMSSNKKRKRGPSAHLYSYYQTICQRLSSEIQMMIHFYIFKESPTELQKKMLQMLDDKDVPHLLEYDSNLTELRVKIQKYFIPLTNAQIMLSEL